MPQAHEKQGRDHFGPVAAQYQAGRPDYPPALFEWLAGQVPVRTLAWDCGTGSGQAARGLAAFFERVVATDASARQLEHAVAHPRIRYRQARAEDSQLSAGSVDLVTVAQALHWFDVDAFHREVQRVLRPGGVIAEWTYGVFRLDSPQPDVLAQHFYREVVGPWWPPERRHVENAYRELAFPFERLSAPAFELVQHWDLAAFLRYLRSWSACARYIAARGTDPVSALAVQLEPVWGEPERRRRIAWPLTLRAGMVTSAR